MTEFHKSIYGVNEDFLKVGSKKISYALLNEYEYRFNNDLEKNKLLKLRFDKYKEIIKEEYKRLNGLFTPIAWNKGDKQFNKYIESYIKYLFSESKVTNIDVLNAKEILNFYNSKDIILDDSIKYTLLEEMEYMSIHNNLDGDEAFVNPLLLMDMNVHDYSLFNTKKEFEIIDRLWNIIYHVSLYGKYEEYDINSDYIKVELNKILKNELNINDSLEFSLPTKLLIEETINFLSYMVKEKDKQKEALSTTKSSEYRTLKAKKKELDSIKILINYLNSSLGKERFCVVNNVNYKRFDEIVANYLDRLDYQKSEAIKRKLIYDEARLEYNIQRILPYIDSVNGKLFGELTPLELSSIIDVPMESIYRKLKTRQLNNEDNRCSKMMTYQRKYLNLDELSPEKLLKKMESINMTINGEKVSDEDKLKVYNFMITNNYQLCYVTYSQLLREYMTSDRSFVGLDRKSIYKDLELRRTFNEIKNCDKKRN